MDTKTDENSLVNWARTHPEINKLFIFGSILTDKLDPSDIDVAIQVQPEGGSVYATYMAIWPSLLEDAPKYGCRPFHYYGFNPDGNSEYDLAVRKDGKVIYDTE